MLTSLRQVSRSLRRSPASAVAAILTLTLTLASATAIFAVVDATLLTPPPFHEPDALVAIGEVPATAPGSAPRPVSARTFHAWRAQAKGAVRLEAYDPLNVTLTGGSYPERLSAMAVSPGFLALLGVTPRIGRPFSDSDALSTSSVIVSDEFWRTKLLGDPNPIGRTLTIGGQPRSIIGVLPSSFAFSLDRSALWLPLNAVTPTDGLRVRIVGRLTPGVTAATAAALLQPTADQSRGMQPAVSSLRALWHGRASELMPLLLIAAGLGIALAAINLAGLMMLRAMERSRELAVRAALGATRVELLKPLLIEAHVLVVAGALFGALLALWITPVAAQLAATQLGIAVADVTIGWRAGAALLAVALVCAWLCALGPALTAARHFDLSRIGREQMSASRATVTLRRTFVAAEIAVAFVLLASVMLVGRSLQAVIAIEPGFTPNGVLAAALSLPAGRYGNAQAVAGFYQQLEDALGARLGRRSVAIIDELPLSGSSAGRVRIALDKDATTHDAVLRVVGGPYFELMQIPVIDGSAFDDRDRSDMTPRAVISRSLADLMFPNGRPIGRTMSVRSLNGSVEILGVVGDVKHRALDEETMPTLYVSSTQQPSNSNLLVLKTGRPDADTLDIVRAEVARIDPELPVYGAKTLEQAIRSSAGVPLRRVVSTTFAAFALLALVIAAVGVFGVVAHDVSARRVEMALRLALGAHPRRLHHAVLRQAFAILAAGLAAGMMLSLLVSRVLDALLYGVTATDAITISFVTALLTATMLLAASLPARRAARTDPVEALRVN